jgi:hypothetical protein
VEKEGQWTMKREDERRKGKNIEEELTSRKKQAGAELCQAQAKLGLAKLAFSLLED